MLNWIAIAINSDFLYEFPGADLITLIVTIFAINVATTNFIISKIQELQRIKNTSFANSYKTLNSSITVQLILIILSFVILIVRSSTLLDGLNEGNKKMGVGIAITFVLIYSISVLWDTGRSMFLISKANEGK